MLTSRWQRRCILGARKQHIVRWLRFIGSTWRTYSSLIDRDPDKFKVSFECIWKQDEVCHYQIRRHGEDAFFSIDNQTPVHGLDSLIQHYQQDAHGLVTQLTSMIKKDPPPHDTRSHGRTNLLHRATKMGEINVVSELLKCGYRNIDAKNQDGQTAVHLACLHEADTDCIIKILIDSGANVNCRDKDGNTALHVSQKHRLATGLLAQTTGFVHLSNSTRVKVDRLQWLNYWSMPKPIFKPGTMAPAACLCTTLHPRGTLRRWNNCSNWVHHICREHQMDRCRSTMLVMLATLQSLNI